MNLLAIDYAFRPRLRTRLTLRGMTFRRKPYAYGGEDSHLPYRYSFQHNHFSLVHESSPSRFNPNENAPLPRIIVRRRLCSQSFGCMLEPRLFSAPPCSTSELLRTL